MADLNALSFVNNRTGQVSEGLPFDAGCCSLLRLEEMRSRGLEEFNPETCHLQDDDCPRLGNGMSFIVLGTGASGYCTCHDPARMAGHWGAPLAVSRVMDPTQWLVSRNTNSMQLSLVECLPPKESTNPGRLWRPDGLDMIVTRPISAAFLAPSETVLDHTIRATSQNPLCAPSASLGTSSGWSLYASSSAPLVRNSSACSFVARSAEHPSFVPYAAAASRQKDPLNDRLMESCIRHQPMRITLPNLLDRPATWGLLLPHLHTGLWPFRLSAACTPLPESPHRLFLIMCAHTRHGGGQ